jgi:uncharacterized protein YcbX
MSIEMTLINTALTPSSSDRSSEDLTISIKGQSKSVSIPARPTTSWLKTNTTLSEVDIWGTKTDGYIYSDSINSTFSSFFGKKVKLVYKGPTPRILGPEFLGGKDSTLFPDVMPLLVANEASLEELNTHMDKKESKTLTIERFRPNIIIRGDSAAWSEDSWKTLRISSHTPDPAPAGGIIDFMFGTSTQPPNALDVDITMRCARCQVPNVDPNTAEKDKHEPWDTLVGYRRVDEGIKWKPCFGMLGLVRREDVVEVGMRVEVVERTDKHNYKTGP